MGFTEVLRLVVDLDAKGAVDSAEKFGTTSERNAQKAEKSLDKWGNKMTSVGTGMIAFGAVAIAGLGAAAMASEEAELSVLKLENTVANAPKLAGESTDQFIKLAESIQGVTAADADAIVEAEALLGTFSLTADQIKNITPLVVDYARKFGVDLPNAAVQVGKALDGSIGALKKNGVSIDETLYKTDRYAAVQKALSEQVGGFAEAEGKTFAGSLQRLKNQLGDLVEGVGAGAVDAFTTLARVTGGVTDRLNELSPGTTSMIGKFATFGAVGLVAAGGMSVVIGQVMQAHERFSAAAEGVSALTEKLGGVKNAAGLLIGGAALGGVALALYEIGEARDAAELEDLIENFAAMGDKLTETSKKAVEQADEFGQLDKVITGLIDSDVKAAESTIALAEAAGISKERVKEWRSEIDQKRQADIKATVNQEDYSEEVRDGADAMDENAEATENAKTALQEWSDQQRAAMDPLFAFNDAMVANHEAQARVVEAELKVVAAEGEVANARKEHGRNSEEATEAALKLVEAQNDLDEAHRNATQSAQDYDSAFVGLKDSMIAGTTTVADAKATIDRWAASGLISASSAAFYRREVDKLTGAIRQQPERRATTVEVKNAAQAREQMRSVRDTANSIPRNVNIHVSVSGRTATELLAGYGALPGRAGGGDVQAGGVYRVGENGEEILVMNGGASGHVYTKDQVRSVGGGGSAGGWMGGGGPTINNFDFRGAFLPGTDEVERAVGKAVDGAMRNGYITTVASR